MPACAGMTKLNPESVSPVIPAYAGIHPVPADGSVIPVARPGVIPAHAGT